MIEGLLHDIPFVFRFCIVLMAGLGILLVVYGLVAEWTGEKFGPLERIAETLAAIVTISGTALTGAAVYFAEATPPEAFSKHFTAPALIICCGVALFLVCRGRRLSPTILNGFAIVAISAALLRLQPNPYLMSVLGGAH